MDIYVEKKQFSLATGKLHIPCPHRASTGIKTHVVIKDGYCYRSRDCMAVWCRFNRLQTDIKILLSLVW